MSIPDATRMPAGSFIFTVNPLKRRGNGLLTRHIDLCGTWYERLVAPWFTNEYSLPAEDLGE